MRTALVVSALLVIAAQAFAGGLIAEPGGKADAMGGAYIGIADDLSAIYWNPAGLAQIKKEGIELDTSYAMMNAKSDGSLGNSYAPNKDTGDFPIQTIYSNEPPVYSSNKMEIYSLLPLGGGYAPCKDYTIAVGAYVAGGGVAQWKDSLPDSTGKDTINASVDGYSAFLIYNASVAREISPGFSVGVGLDAVQVIQQNEIKKEYIKGAGSAVPSGYLWDIQQSDSGVGFQGNLGAQYSLNDKIKLGAVWRSGTKIQLNGSAASTATNLPIANVHTDVQVQYVYPMSYGAGLSYRASEDLLLAFGLDSVNYYALRDEQRYLTPNAIFTDTNEGMGWHDTVKAHIGALYRLDDKLSVMAGAENDPCPFNRTTLTLLNANQYDAYTYSFGAVYNLWDNIEFGAMLHYTMTDKPEYLGQNYELPIMAIQVSASYRI